MLNFAVKGVPETMRALKRIVPVIHGAEATAVRATCAAIRDTARRLAPFRTGELQKSIIYRTKRAKGDGAEQRYVGYVGIKASSPAVGYWHFLEFGTSVYPAHPFFGPAGQAEKTPYTNRMHAMGRRLEAL